MITYPAQLRLALSANHLSLTKGRRIVYEQLASSEPLTMQALITACLSEVDPVSVYRTINLFERLGIVQRLQIGWKYKLELSNNFQEHHHHLTCVSCGQIIPLGEDDMLENRLTALARGHGFTPEDHQLEIRGICKACQTT